MASRDIEDSAAAPADPPALKKGTLAETQVETLLYGGKAFSRTDAGQAIIVQNPCGVVPGQRLQVRITKTKSKQCPPESETATDRPGPPAMEGWSQAVITPSALQVEPRCQHFGRGCGGCKTQNLGYPRQLAEKQMQVEHLYRQANLLDDTAMDQPLHVKPIIGCEESGRIFNYRNKMEFSVGTSLWTEQKPPRARKDELEQAEETLRIGLHAVGRFDKIVAIDECHLHEPIGNAILKHVEHKAQSLMWEAHDQRKHTGFFRNLMIKTATNAEGELEIMVNFVTSPTEVMEPLQELAADLASKFPSIVSVVLNTTRTLSGVSAGEREHVLYGRSYIEQILRGRRFRISANSFFQPNPRQAEVLYREIERCAKLTGTEIVVDLFCGTGSIGLCLASKCKKVVGIELVEAAVNDARRNAQVNGIENAEFLLADLNDLRKGQGSSQVSSLLRDIDCDVMIVDPPRSGLHPDLIKRHINVCQPSRLIYVSCNPSSQARDLLLIKSVSPYSVASVQPVDMFPHTPHIECVTLLTRRAGNEKEEPPLKDVESVPA